MDDIYFEFLIFIETVNCVHAYMRTQGHNAGIARDTRAKCEENKWRAANLRIWERMKKRRQKNKNENLEK